MQCYKEIIIEHNGKKNLVPCGHCNFCLQNRRNDWAFRLLQENKVSNTSHFLTLTYDNQHLPFTWEDDYATGTTLEKKHLYEFHETVKRSQRRLLKKNYDQWKIRYYSVGEYGTRTERPHYHTIMFNLHPITLSKLQDGMIWGKGRVHSGTVTPGSVSYVAKYVIDKQTEYKDEWPEEKQKPFNSMSRNPGIGANYLINRDWHREINDYDPDNFRIYAMQDGKKVRLPRYYKDKIFKETGEWYKDILTTSLELHNMQLSEEFEKTYIAQIEELEEEYGSTLIAIEKYNERKKHHHDSIRIKSHKLNKL
ncbi:MAG: replication initiator protein [Microviridae sp.]|nr:MAG: replication initiator protein [Microviridae sp.]